MHDEQNNQSSGSRPWFFYGYIIVIAAFLAQFAMFGPRSTFGLYIIPFAEEFDWPRGLISGAFSVSTIIIGLGGIVAGGINDRFGPRLMITFCGLVMGAGYLLMSRMEAPWQLYLYFSLLTGLGMSGFNVPMPSTVAKWFVKRRSMMTSLVLAGGGIGGLVTPPLITLVIERYGWKDSFLLMGVIVTVIIVIVAQFLRKSPASMGLSPYVSRSSGEKSLMVDTFAEGFTVREALVTSQLWMAAVMQFCQGFCMITMMVHIAPYAIGLGLSSPTAALIVALISGAHVTGVLVFGNIADRIGTRKVYMISFILLAAALLWLLQAREPWSFFLFAIVLGIGGGAGSLTSPLVAELFGIRAHGLLLGLCAFATTLGAATGPFLAGYIFDVLDSYSVAFYISAATAFAGLVLSSLLRVAR